MLIDAHAHLTSTSLLPELDGILERAKQAGIKKIVNICTDEASLNAGLEVAAKNPWIYNTAATTPHDVDQDMEHFFPIVEKCAQEGKLIALGETGLDYYYKHSAPENQKRSLLLYFSLAKKLKLPLIFHCRDAFSDLFSLADHHYADQPAVLHCFTGTMEEAKEVLNRGWYLSFSGIITFKNAASLREVVKMAPLDRFLIETDSPYLAPLSFRGKKNEPAFLRETATLIATLKGCSLEEIAQRSTQNAEQFFSFSKVS